MAKLGKINQNNRRLKMAKGQAPKRARLKAEQKRLRDEGGSLEEMLAVTQKLAVMPRNGAKSRYRMRCELTGRPRGNYRKLKLCRIKLRELASSGQIPGMIKASW